MTSAAGVTGPSTPRLAPLQTIEPVSAVSAVTRRLLDFFTSGEIAAGDRLPAERQLAAQLGVGRSAVREALAALELLGIVSVRPGSGTYLKGSVSELLPQTLSWGLWLGEPKTVELIQVRQVLEVQVARLAAVLASDEQREAIDVTLVTMREHRTSSPCSSRPTCGSTRSSPRRRRRRSGPRWRRRSTCARPASGRYARRR